MSKSKKLDKQENMRVVTSNDLISARALNSLSLNARKLLYIAISQCRKDDAEFYEYETTPKELAEIWGVDRSNVYRAADDITDELMKLFLRWGSDTEKSFRKRHVFETCDYDDKSKVVFKLHPDMADLLLGLKRDFSKPLLWDFMRMRSPYSMQIWHLMQREMKSFKPMTTKPITFDLTLEELREATGTRNKLKGLSEFKRFVLDKALKEIREKCFVSISYENIKQGKIISGFWFTAESVFGTFDDMDAMPYRMKKHLRKAQLVNKRLEGNITEQEREELEMLERDLEQITLEDVSSGYLNENP